MAYACFERASPAVKEILLKIHRAKNPMEIDHQLHEFGYVHYHVQMLLSFNKHSASDPIHTYLSISTPLLSQGLPVSSQAIYPDVMETVEPPNEGYQLTLKLNLSRIPHGKATTKIITDISSVQAVLLSSQLKEILRNFDSHEKSYGTCKPIKLVYHPREPFFVIKQILSHIGNKRDLCLIYKDLGLLPLSPIGFKPAKVVVVFPMRFKDHEDVTIAIAFFQELNDVGNSETWSKAPRCTWSAIPPPELRGGTIEDLSTNCGFISFGTY
ncbi:hypothetical protein OROGR_015712 [Orobanche gracilis]